MVPGAADVGVSFSHPLFRPAELLSSGFQMVLGFPSAVEKVKLWSVGQFGFASENSFKKAILYLNQLGYNWER